MNISFQNYFPITLLFFCILNLIACQNLLPENNEETEELSTQDLALSRSTDYTRGQAAGFTEGWDACFRIYNDTLRRNDACELNTDCPPDEIGYFCEQQSGTCKLLAEGTPLYLTGFEEGHQAGFDTCYGHYFTNDGLGSVDETCYTSEDCEQELYCNQSNYHCEEDNFDEVAFTTLWNTHNSCDETKSHKEINLLTNLEYQYDFNIDWGDGSPRQTHIRTSISHEYAEEGIYTIKISGQFPHMFFADENLREKKKEYPQIRSFSDPTASYSPAFIDYKHCPNQLIDVLQWGKLKWKTMNFMFAMNQKIETFSADDLPDLSQATGLNGTFYMAKLFNHPLNKWDTSNIRDMESTFESANTFNQPLNRWNTSNVENMSQMFRGALYFNRAISVWDTSKVKTMTWMFYWAKSFNQALNRWDTSNVENMSYMFAETRYFNRPLNDWDTSKVKTMSGMFRSAERFNKPLDNWDTSNVKNMSWMFSNTTRFNQPLENWDTSNVKDMAWMFGDSGSFNQPLENWDTSNVEDMSWMFYRAGFLYYPLGRWNIEKVKSMKDFTSGGFKTAEDYDRTLWSWNGQRVQPNVEFDAGGSTYCRSETARSSMISIDNWSISDRGQRCDF